MAFNTPLNQVVDHQTISWSQFRKTLVPRYTFWDWFYANMKIVREHLSTAWKDGYIEGFISKHNTEQKLLVCPPGTFLIRFSESVLGNLKTI